MRVNFSGIRVVVISALLSLTASSLTQADDVSPEQQQREAVFSEQLGNSVLTGSFTVDGDETVPKPERYEIESVTKATGNLWTFMTRIKYGKTDARLPVTVPVVWAGDTPMVQLTNATIPGLGQEFSARVIFYENRYAGTWQDGTKGGLMFGTFRKAQAE